MVRGFGGKDANAAIKGLAVVIIGVEVIIAVSIVVSSVATSVDPHPIKCPQKVSGEFTMAFHPSWPLVSARVKLCVRKQSIFNAIVHCMSACPSTPTHHQDQRPDYQTPGSHFRCISFNLSHHTVPKSIESPCLIFAISGDCQKCSCVNSNIFNP